MCQKEIWLVFKQHNKWIFELSFCIFVFFFKETNTHTQKGEGNGF